MRINRKTVYLAMLLTGALLLVGCKKKEPARPADENPNWEVSEKIEDVTSNMTMIIALADTLQEKIQSEDTMSAFCNNYCIGVCKPEETINGTRFFLMIYDPGTLASDDDLVTLKYYSTGEKRIYTDDEGFEFFTDLHMGLTSNPYIPKFK